MLPIYCCFLVQSWFLVADISNVEVTYVIVLAAGLSSRAKKLESRNPKDETSSNDRTPNDWRDDDLFGILLSWIYSEFRTWLRLKVGIGFSRTGRGL